MPSFKKIISALCAAAVAATTAVVPALATPPTIPTEDSFETYDFSQNMGNASVSDETIPGIKLYMGSRSGGDSGSNFGVVEENPRTGSKALKLVSGRFGGGGRSPRAILEAPVGVSSYTISMWIYNNEVQRLGYSDTDEKGIKIIECTPNEWHKLDIYILGTSRVMMLDGAPLATDTSANGAVMTPPIIWSDEDGHNPADGGMAAITYIDDYSVQTLTEKDAALLLLNNIDLKYYTKYNSNGDGTLTTNDIIIPTNTVGTYGVATGTFGIDTVIGETLVSWSSSNESLVEITGRNEVTVYPSSTSATVTLTAEVKEYGVSRKFTLNLQGTSDFLKYVADQIDLTDGNSTVSHTMKDGEVVKDSYDVISGFTAPTALSGATISWSSADPDVTISGGSINLRNWDALSHTITATISSNGQTHTKDITIAVPAVRVFYDDDYTDWTAGNLVDLTADHATNNAHPGYSFTSVTRPEGASDSHRIYVASDNGIDGNYINNVLTALNDNGSRPHSMTLTKMSGVTITKDLYVDFDFRLNTDSTTLRITDGSSNIDIDTSCGISTNVWYHLTLTILSGGSYTGTITSQTGAVIATLSGSSAPASITTFTGTANYYSFAFDNLYIASGDVPAITPTGKTNVTTNTTETIATVARAKDENITVDLGDLAGKATATVENGAVKINGTSEGKGTVKITAKADIEVSTTVDVSVGTENKFAKDAAEDLASKLVNGSTVKAGENANTIVVSNGNLTVPETLYGATVSLDSKNKAYVTDKGVIYPAIDAPDTIEVEVNAAYGTSGKATGTITVDIRPYKALVKAEYDKAMSDTVKIPYADSITPGRVYHDITDSNAVIYNNLKFPTKASATGGSITVDYKVEDNDYLAATGEISLADTKPHQATIKRTVTYKKDNVTLAGGNEETYTRTVQFDPKAVEDFLIARNTGALWSQNDEWEIRDEYLKEMVYDYMVKFDAACDANYSSVPATATEDFKVPVSGDKTMFGSNISWSSNNAALIPRNTGEVVVKQPSSTVDVTLTATVTYMNADEKTRQLTVTVTGSGSGGSGGGGGGAGGGAGSGGGAGAGGSNFNGAYNGGYTKGGIDSAVIGSGGFVPVDKSGVEEPNPNPSGFNDLDSVPWAVTAINNLCVSGVINGKAPGMFCPNDNVTRAEFAKILVGAFRIPAASVTGATFTDVPMGHWAISYIETAYQNGIITGYDNGAFDPDAYVTRQDMAVMVQRAASVMGYSLDPVEEAITFTDAADIAAYAQEAVATLQQADIVNGVGDNAFEPLSTSTRAQACQMLYNVWN